MTDTTTLQALLMAAGMATASGLIFDEPASEDLFLGVMAADTNPARYVAKFGLQLLFGKGKQ